VAVVVEVLAVEVEQVEYAQLLPQQAAVEH
jgi:hypothetical protein